LSIIKLPEYGEHIVFAGTTGAGKSYLAQEMLKKFDKTFIIDTQDSLSISATKVDSPKGLKLKLFWFKKIRYVPKPEYMNSECWNYVFRTLLESSTKKRQKPRIIYIDEIYHVGYGASFPTWLPKAITTGRQRKLSFWISTQRPSQIPMPILSECTRFYVFYLGYEDDIKKLAKFCRKGELKEGLVGLQFNYGFIEVDRALGSFVVHNKLKIKNEN